MNNILYRSGDIVKYKDQIVEITSGIYNLGVNLSNGYTDVFIKDLEPLLLDEETLKKLGFKFVDAGGLYDDYYELKLFSSIITYSSTSGLYVKSKDFTAHASNIRYVHQLQRVMDNLDELFYYCGDKLVYDQ